MGDRLGENRGAIASNPIFIDGDADGVGSANNADSFCRSFVEKPT